MEIAYYIQTVRRKTVTAFWCPQEDRGKAQIKLTKKQGGG
jgi:hypothetical protein